MKKYQLTITVVKTNTKTIDVEAMTASAAKHQGLLYAENHDFRDSKTTELNISVHSQEVS